MNAARRRRWRRVPGTPGSPHFTTCPGRGRRVYGAAGDGAGRRTSEALPGRRARRDRAPGGLTRPLRLRAAAAPRPKRDADALVAGTADLVRRTVGPGIGVELRLRDGAGSVLCDPNELESALLNLCINARDAMPEGGRLVIGTADVRLSATDVAGQDGAAPGDYVAVSVADTGAGMPREVLERAFEPFFTTKPLGQGTGLGLSQIYGFVRQSGGVARIESSRARHDGAPVPAEAQPGGGGGGGADGAAVREDAGAGAAVLLVDDEDAVRAGGRAAARAGLPGAASGGRAGGAAPARDGARIDLLVTDVGCRAG